MAMNFEPNECVIFVQSMKIGTHENKAIQSILKEKLPANCLTLKAVWLKSSQG